MQRKVAIIGGGMSGLLCAHFLKKSGHSVQLFEASRRLGGWVNTETTQGRLIEWGPQTLMANRSWRDLIRDLGLKSISPGRGVKNRFIWFNHHKIRLPLGPISFLTSPLLSRHAKSRVLSEAFRKTDLPESDLNLSTFFERVFHRDISQNILDPFVGGIFAGDVNQLSTASCFPKLWDATKTHGSLIRGMFKNRTGDRPQMLSFTGGLSELTMSLEKNLSAEINLNATVERVGRAQTGWRVESSLRADTYDHVILAVPAVETARYLAEILTNNKLQVLKSIFYQKVGVWTTVFERPKDFHSGFGVLIPRAAKQALLGSLWGSEIFKDRCAKDEVVTTQFFAGTNVPKDPEQHLKFLQTVLGIETQPKWQEFRVHERAIPQFGLYHREKMAAFRQNLPKGIHLAGHYLDGVGLTQVMNTAKALTDEMIKMGSESAA